MPSFPAVTLDPKIRTKIEPEHYASLVSSVMTPVTLVSYVFACWRLGADLNWLGEFFVSQGIFSRWQVWLAIAIVTQIGAKELQRLTRPKDTVAS